MKKGLLAIAALAALIGTGCGYSAPVVPPQGLIYTSISAPIDTDADSTPVSPLVGTSSSAAILGLFAFGDASIDTAARAGGITEIHHVDYAYFSILGMYQKFTIRVHGN